MATTPNTLALRDMRDWLKDCAWADMEPEDFDAIPDARVLAGIERHYHGGVAAFLNAAPEYHADEAR